MNTTQKNEKLQFIVQRYDGYYNSIGLRGNMYLVVNAATLTGLMAGYCTSGPAYVGGGTSLLVIFTLICNFASITYTLMALRPIVGDELSTLEYTSVFFGVIGRNHVENYEELWDSIDDKKGNQDMQPQAALFSRGMERKFNALTSAGRLIGTQVVFVIIFVLDILSKASGILK
ncbi:MAG: hypothetical protein K0R82_2826 [Flavipsychrobacter sp.]|nr:hypothetical protein [Flavipsychrobacter sp.]